MFSDFSKSLVNFVEFYNWFETLKILGCIVPQLNSGFPCSFHFYDFCAEFHTTSKSLAGHMHALHTDKQSNTLTSMPSPEHICGPHTITLGLLESQ